ncbi:hypothetical protein CXB51_025689 [Gossypium anomalum]|uniref:Uncharacterized protein n=1 Tax=Gossypium anomalum TaxID=47600 RepID=A0A8J5YK50_9ROSI|nr:hypothetical protein CXB51_025689 [Gossypium anomalum]
MLMFVERLFNSVEFPVAQTNWTLLITCLMFCWSEREKVSQKKTPQPWFFLSIFPAGLLMLSWQPMCWMNFLPFWIVRFEMAAGLVKKFFIASMLMWMAPLAVLYGFNHNLLPAFNVAANNNFHGGFHLVCYRIKLIEQEVNLFGTGLTNLSPHAMTLLSGFVAVISVNIVIAFYIYMAMKEPSNKHQPDPKFLTHAKASVYQPTGEPMESLKKQG